jgi:hypothetical protein
MLHARLLRHPFAQCLDCGSALHHAGTRWKCGGVFGVERRDTGKITLVEEIYPFRIHRLNLGLLAKAGAMSTATEAITSAMLRMTNAPDLTWDLRFSALAHTPRAPVSPPKAE